MRPPVLGDVLQPVDGGGGGVGLGLTLQQEVLLVPHDAYRQTRLGGVLGGSLDVELQLHVRKAHAPKQVPQDPRSTLGN